MRKSCLLGRVKKANQEQQRQRRRRKRYVLGCLLKPKCWGRWDPFWGWVSWVRAGFQPGEGGAAAAMVWKVFWPVSLLSFLCVCPWIGGSKQQKVKRWEKAEISHFIARGERGSTARGSCSSSGAGGPRFVWDIQGKTLCWGECDPSFCLCFLFLFFACQLTLTLRRRGKRLVKLRKLTKHWSVIL